MNVIQKRDDASDVVPDTLECSIIVIASATVARNASAPRRSMIPAVLNVFWIFGWRCVINNPTPRLCKIKAKVLEVKRKSIYSAYPVFFQKFVKYPGSPMNWYDNARL